jgi:hypothetical protein
VSDESKGEGLPVLQHHPVRGVDEDDNTPQLPPPPLRAPGRKHNKTTKEITQAETHTWREEEKNDTGALNGRQHSPAKARCRPKKRKSKGNSKKVTGNDWVFTRGGEGGVGGSWEEAVRERGRGEGNDDGGGCCRASWKQNEHNTGMLSTMPFISTLTAV